MNPAGRGTPQRRISGGSPHVATYGELDLADLAGRPASAAGRCEITAGQSRLAVFEGGGASTATGPSDAVTAGPETLAGGTAGRFRASATTTVTGTATAVAISAPRRRSGSICCLPS